MTESHTGPVTLADVRQVVEDPFQTNANRVREHLGRGSNATIQKHLQTLREELRRKQEVSDSEVPTAPDSVVQNLWATAWTAASAQVRTRLEQITSERDQYREAAEAATADAQAMAEALDLARSESENSTAEHAREREQAAQALAESEARLNAQDQAWKQEREQLQAQVQEHQQKLKDLEHAAALVERDREIERQTLRGEIDRLTTQLAQVQAYLFGKKEEGRTEN